MWECKLRDFFQGAEGLMAAAGTLGRSADEYGNDSRVETLWAMKAMEQAEVYFNVSYPLESRNMWMQNSALCESFDWGLCGYLYSLGTM